MGSMLRSGLDLSVKGSVHVGYVMYVAGWRDNEGLVQVVIGDIAGARMMEFMGAYLDDFVQMALRGKG